MNPAITDLIGGQIDVLVASAPSLLGQVNGQKIRALSVTTANRSDVIAQLPSASELGYAQSAVDLWWGVLAPAGVSPEIVEKLNQAINQALSSQVMRDFLLKEGASASPGTSASFKMHIQDEIKRWKRVAQLANIQAD
jgi:tripartite-type tricarboxylate transporter receptor subunit TctC